MATAVSSGVIGAIFGGLLLDALKVKGNIPRGMALGMDHITATRSHLPKADSDFKLSNYSECLKMTEALCNRSGRLKGSTVVVLRVKQKVTLFHEQSMSKPRAGPMSSTALEIIRANRHFSSTHSYLCSGMNSHGVATGVLSAEEPASAPYAAMTFALVGCFGVILASIPGFQSLLMAILA